MILSLLVSISITCLKIAFDHKLKRTLYEDMGKPQSTFKPSASSVSQKSFYFKESLISSLNPMRPHFSIVSSLLTAASYLRFAQSAAVKYLFLWNLPR